MTETTSCGPVVHIASKASPTSAWLPLVVAPVVPVDPDDAPSRFGVLGWLVRWTYISTLPLWSQIDEPSPRLSAKKVFRRPRTSSAAGHCELSHQLISDLLVTIPKSTKFGLILQRCCKLRHCFRLSLHKLPKSVPLESDVWFVLKVFVQHSHCGLVGVVWGRALGLPESRKCLALSSLPSEASYFVSWLHGLILPPRSS